MDEAEARKEEAKALKKALDSKRAYDIATRRDELQIFTGIIAHLEQSLGFIEPSPDGGALEGRLLTIIHSMGHKETSTAKRIADLEAEVQRYKKDGEGRRRLSLLAPVDPNDKLENKDTIKLQAELELARREFAEMEKTLEDNKQTIAQLTEERDNARTNMEESQTRVEELDKVVARAEKVKSSALTNRDKAEVDYRCVKADYDRLEVRYRSLESDWKLNAIEVTRLKKEVESHKKQYDRTKNLSLAADVNKIKALQQNLEEARSRISALELDIKEKDALLESNKLRVQRSDDEKNEVLQRHAVLQEELASKDMELSEARLKAGAFESATKLAEKERDAVSRKAKLELETVQQELAILQMRTSEREKEIEFWKESGKHLEKKTDDQAAQIMSDFNTIKENNSILDILRSNLAQAQREVAELQDRLQSYGTHNQEQAQTIKQQQDELDDLRRKISDSEAELNDTQLDDSMVDLRSKLRLLKTDESAPNQDSVVLKLEAPDTVPWPLEASSTSESQSASSTSESQSASSRNNHRETLVRMAKELITVVTMLLEIRPSMQQGQNIHQDQQGGTKVAELEVKLQEQAAAYQRDLENANKEYERVKQELNISADQLVEQDKMLQELDKIKSMFGLGPEGTEQRVEFARACEAMEGAMEEVANWMDDVAEANKNRDHMLALSEEQAQLIQRIQNDKINLEEKIVRLERDLERCRGDLKSATTDVAQCKADMKEQEAKVVELEEELRICKHEVDGLKQVKAELDQELEGRKGALKRLQSARETYDRMYTSKIESLNEEKNSLEKLFHSELTKREMMFQQELNIAKEERRALIEQAHGDMHVIKCERDNLKAKMEELERREQENAELQSQSAALFDGYVEFMKILEDDGKLLGESQMFAKVLSQCREDLNIIEGLRNDNGVLRSEIANLRNEMGALVNSNDGLEQLILQYQQDTTKMTNKSEAYLGQIRHYQEQLELLRQGRNRDENTIRALHSSIQVMKDDLGEKTDAIRRLQAATTANDKERLVGATSEGIGGADAPPPAVV
ncbi:hypothetical protein BGX33_006201 [Mortierella sp. NVP41]|nr:hypothetical protein BGX33_006201 [Mortierella sp. NVP41]